jgi:hypothetical protein
MTTSFLFWASIVIAGIIAGAVLRPRTIAVVIAGSFLICLLGLIVTLVMGAKASAWMFGVAGIGVPLVLLVSYILGAVVFAVIRVKVAGPVTDPATAPSPSSPSPQASQAPAQEPQSSSSDQ